MGTSCTLRFRLTVLAAASGAACGLGIAGPAATRQAHAAAPSAAAGYQGLWVSAKSGATLVEADSDHRLNTTGGANKVAAGSKAGMPVEFTVTFGGLGRSGGAGGTAYVDTLTEGFATFRCNAVDWFRAGTDEKVKVACPSVAGQPGRYVTVGFTRALSPSGSLAYARASRPSTTSYAPADQWSTGNAKLTVTRGSPGKYTVRVPKVRPNGTFSVAATSDSAAVCRLSQWSNNVDPVTATVLCRRAGKFADTAFSIAYAADQNILGLNAARGFWAYADRPNASKTYAPSQWRSAGIPPLTILPSPGLYDVEVPNLYFSQVNCSAATPFLIQYAAGLDHLVDAYTGAATCNFAAD